MQMKRYLVGMVVLSSTAMAGDVKPTAWTFDGDKAEAKPRGFAFGRTGKGKQGKWVVKSVDDAPSGKQVLAQIDADKTSDRYPVAVAASPSLGDVAVSVKCKPISGTVDQACGLVLRYQNDKNYYVTRANALEGNVRFYYVKAGKRKELASWSGTITANAWHDYKVEAKGDRFIVTFDGQQVLDVTDKTFTRPGKGGVWTNSDSVTYFDDLGVEAR